MKQFILFSVLIFSAGCATETNRSQQQLAAAQEIPTPTVTSTPFSFPELSESDSRRLNERLPTKSRRVLEQAEEIEIFEIEICREGFSPKLEQVVPDKFQGCRIKRKAKVVDSSIKQQILDGLFYAANTSDSGAMCFSPRHGIRAIYGEERVDLVVCFQCGNFRGISSVGRVGGAISSAPEELFEQIFANVKKN